MRKIIFLLVIVILAACQNEQKQSKKEDSTIAAPAKLSVDTLSFSYDSVKVYSKNPVSENKEITDTAKATVIFPVFKDAKVNDQVKKIALAANGPDDPVFSSYQALVNDFIKGFDDYKAQYKDQQTWFKNIDIHVLGQRSNYIGLKYDFIDYSGGAHGNYATIYLNYNPVTHEVVTLDSILRSGTKLKLTKVAEQIFRKNEGISANQALSEGYFFEKGVFALNENFTITNKGLNFLYNPYEIKSYAGGITELLIPFEQIKDLLKPNPALPAIE